MRKLRFKQFLRERNQFSQYGEETLLSVSEYYGVKPRSEAFESEEHESRAATLEGYRIVQADDLVMNYMLAWKGAYGVSSHSGIVSPAYSVFSVDQSVVDVRYLHHRVRSDDMKAYFRSRSKGIIESRLRLYPDSLLASYVQLPDLATQRQIADFLDRETARIDLLIEKKQRLVALLGEKKNAELYRLEQDLFAGSHEASRLSYHVTKVGSGKTPSGGATVYQDSGILFLRSQNIKNDGVFLVDAAYISEEIDSEMANSRVLPRDILLNITGASLGRCAIAPSDMPPANVNQHVCIIRPMKHLLSEYLHILLLTPRMQATIRSEAFSAGREGLNFESIRNFRIPVPDSLETQQEVADQILSISLRDQKILTANGRSIDRLKEYRSALITAAVTGQINVSEWGKAGTNERHLDAIQAEMEH